MASSDSEGFESADEGSNIDKKERKQRLSSSNYSDSAIDPEPQEKKASAPSEIKKKSTDEPDPSDGWDDFNIDDDDLPVEKPVQTSSKPAVKAEVQKTEKKDEDTGWDNFDDWGDVESKDNKIATKSTSETKLEHDIRDVTDKIAASSGSTWGWGWGVDSILSSATAGLSTITNQVSQGISTVLETGIGAPDPEDMARKLKEESNREEKQSDSSKDEAKDAFPFGSLISGVTKFVETTGTKVLVGGLDTLETIGKKTMEVLQDGDPGLAKKRAMLGLDQEKPVLSQVLREAKAKAEEEDRVKEEKREAKEVHYENLFDDFEGLVHLEALEMLSRQVSMRIEERLRTADPEKKHEIKETLQQVAELCEMPEEDDFISDGKPESLHDRLQTATQDLGLKLQFQPIIKQYTEILTYMESTTDLTDKSIYKRGVSSLAQATALSVELYHKCAEMLLVKTRRSTADEADSLTQMTMVLTKHMSELATIFTEKLNSIDTEDKGQINTYITNIFLEAGNSSTYIQNAFQLALPILQIGAV